MQNIQIYHSCLIYHFPCIVLRYVCSVFAHIFSHLILFVTRMHLLLWGNELRPDKFIKSPPCCHTLFASFWLFMENQSLLLQLILTCARVRRTAQPCLIAQCCWQSVWRARGRFYDSSYDHHLITWRGAIPCRKRLWGELWCPYSYCM